MNVRRKEPAVRELGAGEDGIVIDIADLKEMISEDRNTRRRGIRTLDRSMDGRPPAPKNTFKNASGNASMELSWDQAPDQHMNTLLRKNTYLTVEGECLLPVVWVTRERGAVGVLAPVSVEAKDQYQMMLQYQFFGVDGGYAHCKLEEWRKCSEGQLDGDW